MAQQFRIHRHGIVREIVERLDQEFRLGLYAGLLYSGVSMDDVSAIGDSAGFTERHGLNSRLVKHEGGFLEEQVYREDGMYGSAIRRITRHLEDAMPHATPAMRREVAGFYRRGLAAVARRADNGFRVGIPFIWCSNNLMASFATQALLYRRMTGDERFRELEAAALDWLFGTNPWGHSMVVNLPHDGVWSQDPHTDVARQFGPRSQTGGLLDGPVYRSIFSNLRGINLWKGDEYAQFNTGFIVFHDDFGDYSTNEPIMDGTANLSYLLSAMAVR